jgi:hypothetical protein
MSMSNGPSRMFVAPTIYREADAHLCVFCNGSLSGSRSREHIFPKWLLRHYGALDSGYRIDWTSDPDGDLFGRRELPMRSLVAGRVCRKCNVGWMSQLEQDCGELLRALMDAERPIAGASVAERELLARWCVKTAFSYRSADPAPNLVDPVHAQMLAEGDLPPVHVVARQTPTDLGLGSSATQRWLVSYPRPERAAVEQRVGRSHKTVLMLGHLCVAVCFWPDAGWPVVISRRSHTPLWPARAPWLTYAHATDRHGAPRTRETELIDMVVGTRVAHPASQGQFSPIDADRF